MHYALAILIVLIGKLSSYAQPIGRTYRSFSSSHGISNKLVTCITKDDRGFLWLGTGEGLNRFDGKQFITYYTVPSDQNSLAGNFVYSILLYKPGQLLIATNKGLSIFNTYSNRFQNEITKTGILQKVSNNLVRSLFADKAGNVYINYSGKVDVYSPNLEFLYCLTDLPWCQSMKGIIVNHGRWFQDRKGQIWAPSDNLGIQIIDKKNEQVYNKQNNANKYPFFNITVVRSLYYNEERQWLFCGEYGNGIVRYDLNNGSSKSQQFNISYSGEARSINAIIEYNKQLFCCGGQSMYRVNPETLEYENIDDGFENAPSGLFSNCRTAFKENGNIWIGTESKGVVQFPLIESSITELKLPFTVTDFSNYTTGIIRASNGLIYFAYNMDGLSEMDPQSFYRTQYKYNGTVSTDKSINRICEDGKNRLWAGTNKGIIEFDKITKKFIRPTWLPVALRKVKIFYLFTDSKGNVWISYSDKTDFILGCYNVQKEQLTEYRSYRSGASNFFDPSKRISRIVEDDLGFVWIISVQGGGIASYDLFTESWRSPIINKKIKELLQTTGLNGITVIGSTIWAGNTSGLSLLKYNYISDSLFSFTRKEGLSSENIMAITKYKDGRLFLATQAGINFMDPEKNKIYPLVTKNESIDWARASIQFYDSISNQLFYGLNDRLVIVNGLAWEPKKNLPFTYLHNFKINSRLLSLPETNKPLSLNHLKKNMTIEFAAPDFSGDAAIEYAYMLTGADNSWSILSAANSANFSSLSPGNYTFKVKARLQTGNWGPINEKLRFIIYPPFWQTLWFLATVFVFVVAMITWLVRRRIQNIRSAAALKQKISETEMIALRAQMNPHFIFNCLNAIDDLIQTNQKGKATTYLSKFAKLIRSVLDSSKNNLVPFQKDFESLRLYIQMEQFRCSHKFEFLFTADNELLQSDYKVPPLIIQPFVENAILHGLLNKEDAPRELKVMVTLQKDCIHYTITDNGVGRAKAQEFKNINKPEHQSVGILITKERLLLYNRNKLSNNIIITDLIEDDQPAGTRVEIFLSLANS